MSEDAGGTGIANLGGRAVDLLCHGADQAGELGKFAGDDCVAKIDIAEYPIEGILVGVVGRGAKEFGSRGCPVLCRRGAQSLLALEVVKKGTRGHARRVTEVADGSGGKSLGPDDIAGRLEEPGTGVATLGI